MNPISDFFAANMILVFFVNGLAFFVMGLAISEGTVTRLSEIGQKLGYQVHVVPPLVLNGQTVSSTLIRNLFTSTSLPILGNGLLISDNFWNPGFVTRSRFRFWA